MKETGECHNCVYNAGKEFEPVDEEDAPCIKCTCLAHSVGFGKSGLEEYSKNGFLWLEPMEYSGETCVEWRPR